MKGIFLCKYNQYLILLAANFLVCIREFASTLYLRLTQPLPVVEYKTNSHIAKLQVNNSPRF